MVTYKSCIACKRMYPFLWVIYSSISSSCYSSDHRRISNYCGALSLSSLTFQRTHAHAHTNKHTHTHTHTPCSQNNNVRNVLPVSPSLCLPRQMSAISNFTSLMSASVITDISRHRNNFHRQGSCNTRREIRLLERRCCGSYKMLYKILQRKISGYCFIHEIFCVS